MRLPGLFLPDAVCDTGASVNLIRKDTWDKLDLPAPKPPPPLPPPTGADAVHALPVIGIADIPFTLYRGKKGVPHSKTSRFLIVATCTDPIILGKPALHKIITHVDLVGDDHVWHGDCKPAPSAPVPLAPIQELSASAQPAAAPVKEPAAAASTKEPAAAAPTKEPAAAQAFADTDSHFPLQLHEAAIIPANGAITVAVRYDRGLDKLALEKKEDIFIEPIALHNRDYDEITVSFTGYIKSPNQGLQPHHYLILRNTTANTISLPIGRHIGRACTVRTLTPLPERKAESTLVHLIRRVVTTRAVKDVRRRLRRFKKEEEKERALNKFVRDRRLPVYTRAEHKVRQLVRQVRAALDPTPPRSSKGDEPSDEEFFKDFDADKKLTAEQLTALRQVLHRNRVVFSKLNIGDPAPRATGVEFVINTGNAQPLKQAPYRQPPFKRTIINNEVANLLQHGLITPSFSPWGSPVLLVQKKDGSQRMCIDYRKLNALTKKDAYPLPLIEDCLERLKDAKFMTVIDLADAYHHIPMSPDSKAATAFVTQDGLYEWEVMPFGATGCPGAFQRYVDQVLRGLIGTICTAYFDDIVVYTNGDFDQHLIDLEQVLRRLSDHHLRAKLKKCHFGYDSVLFVGHIVHNGTIRPDPEKVKAIQEIPQPQDVTHLKSFLGLANYYRKFIDGFAKMALPLYKLTKKGEPWVWAGEQDAAFHSLKRGLLGAKCLRAPDFKEPFILQTDASNEGLGAVLVQRLDGEEHPVAFISKQLKPAEKNYSATELEALAIVWGIKTFEHYLVDRHFTVVTDHHALHWFPQTKSLNKRLSRWALYLSEFDFAVEYRKGKDNANADALSRNPLPLDAQGDAIMEDVPTTLPIRSTPHASYPVVRAVKSRPVDPGAGAELKEKVADQDQMDIDNIGGELFESTPESLQQLIEAQRADPKLQPLIRYLERQQAPHNLNPQQLAILLRRASQHTIDPDTKALYCVRQPRDGRHHSEFMSFQRRLVVPDKLRAGIMETFHDSPFGGHSGISRTYRKIALRYDWDGMYADIQAHVGRCPVCLGSKAKRIQELREHPHMEHPRQPFEVIAMDYVGPLTQSQDFKYILVIVDMFTGWAITVPTLNCDATTTSRILLDCVINQHGVPRKVLSDNQFDNQLLTQFTKGFKIHQTLISPHHPQTNGMVERLNGTLKAIMRTASEVYGTNWALYLQASTFAYNISPKERDGISPFYALYGRHPFIPGEVLAGEVEFDPAAEPQAQYVRDIINRLREAHYFMTERIEAARRAAKEERNTSRSTRAYQIGDRVYLKHDRDRGPKANAFVARYRGPFEILARIGDVNYDIGARDRNGKLNTIQLVHVDDLRKVPAPADHNPAATILSTTNSTRPMLPIVPPDALSPAATSSSPSQEPPKHFALHTRPKKPRVVQTVADRVRATSTAPTNTPTAPPRRRYPNRHARKRLHRQLSDAERRHFDFTDIQPTLTLPPAPPPAHTPQAPAIITRPSRQHAGNRPNYSESFAEPQQVLEAVRDLSLPIRS